MVVQLYVVVCDDGSRYVIVCDDVTWSSVRGKPVSQLVYLRHVRYITQHHLGETSSLGESIRPDEGVAEELSLLVAAPSVAPRCSA